MENVNKPTFQEIDSWINSLEIKDRPYKKPIPGFPYMVVSIRSKSKGGKKSLYVRDISSQIKILDVGEFTGNNSEELFLLAKSDNFSVIKDQIKTYGFPEKGLPFDEPKSEENKDEQEEKMDIREVEILQSPKRWIERFINFFAKGERRAKTE